MTPRVLSRLLGQAFRHRVRVFAAVAALVAIAVLLLGRLRVSTNVLDLLPEHSPSVQAFRQYLDAFGSLDRLYLMFEAPPDHSIGEYDDEIDAYVAKLRALPEIVSVESAVDDPGKDWSYLGDRQLLLLGPANVGTALERFSGAGLDAALADARNRLGLPSEAMRTLVQQDPLGLFLLMRDRLSGEGTPFSVDPTQRGVVSSDGRARLVIAKPSHPPYDTTFAHALNAKLDALTAGVRADAAASSDPLPPLVVKDAGGYRAAAESETLIRREGIVNSVVSFALIVGLAIALFRSVRPLVAIFLPIVVAALLTVGLAGLTHALSAASAGSAAILFGLGVDGTLMLYINYLQLRRDGVEAEPAAMGLATTALGMTIAFATTAATFFGVVPVDLPALSELGKIIGVGILICAALTIVITPALLPRRPGALQTRRFHAAGLATFVQRRRRVILVVAAIATVVLGAAAFRLKLGLTVDKLAPHTPAVDVQHEIAARFNLPEDALVAINTGPSLEALLQQNEALSAALKRERASLAFTPASQFVPSQAAQARTMALVRAQAIDPQTFAVTLERAADRAGFRAGSFGPFLERLPRVVDPAQTLTVDGYATHGLGDLLARFIARHDDAYSTVTYIYPRGSEDLAAAERAVASVGAPMALTGLPIVNRDLADRFPHEFARGAIIGVVAVAILLVAGFRRVGPALLAMAPTALGILWSVGILAISGVELDLFSVFALLMSIGIGVDYSVYVLVRARADRAGGVHAALTQAAPGILMAGASTIIGFGSLVASSYTPMRALGLVTAITVTACLVASLVVLPALLEDRA
jgi:predicted RND superfamily exporter protein